MAQGDLDGATALLDAARSLLAEDARPPEVEQAALYLDLYREARELGALGAADDAAEAMASKDPERLHKLALQLFAERKHKQALDAALASVRADRQWNDRAAQKLLLASFKALGADNPSVRGARARLTNILFV
ncbi:hypothetical protein QBZ16_002021 [Prototheca wickerhamii]|uniref:Tetratricopeptide repeat protein n=1 Tax=Prototheca wickerhamii TaxID=3111 RepID=A0AAD9IJK9_PROWI|nr:hypothetical protein QBZ16_002021 [Prototheca wickerhamii]